MKVVIWAMKVASSSAVHPNENGSTRMRSVILYLGREGLGLGRGGGVS